MSHKRVEAIEREQLKGGHTWQDYTCGFCRACFSKLVKTSTAQGEEGKGQVVSTQVKCPKCKNFVKTWGN